jgi:hypothetical protein
MIDKGGPGGVSMPISALETLCSILSKGLHAAAQPLTILRASLDKGQIDGMSIGDLHELATSSAVEVERVCRLFSSLKELVDVEGVKPQLSEIAIMPVLADLADGFDRLFEKDGMFLSVMVPDNCQPVRIDKARTVRALSIVLLIAHGLSRAKETVELIVSSSSASMVRLVVRNLDSTLEAFSAEVTLTMALADANIRSQGALFSWGLRPFRVQIDLQNAQVAVDADIGLFSVVQSR